MQLAQAEVKIMPLTFLVIGKSVDLVSYENDPGVLIQGLLDRITTFLRNGVI
jgi:hypothetical protein